MIRFNKDLPTIPQNLILAFDLEWTKNYKIKNGNAPFCFSFIYFAQQDPTSNYETLEFGFTSGYIQTPEEETELLNNANTELGKLLKHQGVLVGHQLVSDISVILSRTGNTKENFTQLKHLWQIRKAQDDFHVKIFDTRYDLVNYLTGESRRLVDVCTESGLNVHQPELQSSSMTKMQNEFYKTQDNNILEKLQILNIRHSLSCAILYNCYINNYKPTNKINVNKILYNNLKDIISYLNTPEFPLFL
jgi:hypothetical protein